MLYLPTQAKSSTSFAELRVQGIVQPIPNPPGPRVSFALALHRSALQHTWVHQIIIGVYTIQYTSRYNYLAPQLKLALVNPRSIPTLAF
jgi:hypothetical protein